MLIRVFPQARHFLFFWSLTLVQVIDISLWQRAHEREEMGCICLLPTYCHVMCSLAAIIASRTMQGEGRSRKMRYSPTVCNRQKSCLLQHLMPYICSVSPQLLWLPKSCPLKMHLCRGSGGHQSRSEGQETEL